MRLMLVQSSPRLDNVEANLAAIASAVGEAVFDLLVLPELFATGYFFHNHAQVRRLSEPVPGGPSTTFLTELARSREGFVCGGLIEREGDRLYNTAVLVGPEGLIARYRKLHLFYEEKIWFTPGDGLLEIHELGTTRVGMMICFDWRYPEVARILALKGAQILLHPANLVQPYCQDAMVTRCLENGIFATTANRIGTDIKPDGTSLTFTGRSQVVSPQGEVLVRAPRDETAVLAVAVDPGAADDKYVTEHNHLLGDRRPEHYGLIAGRR